MFKRFIAISIAVGAALCLPTAALAVDADVAGTAALTCTSAQVLVNGSFGCTVTGGDGEATVLRATFLGGGAGAPSTTASEPLVASDGDSEFQVTAPDSQGTIVITAMVDGRPINAQAEVEVVNQTVGAGLAGAPLAIAAASLLAAGAATLFVAASRKRSRSSGSAHSHA